MLFFADGSWQRDKCRGWAGIPDEATGTCWSFLNVSWFMSPATDIDIVFHMLIMRRSFSYQMKCHPLIRGDNMRCTHVFSGIRKWSCEEDAFHPCKEISQNYKRIGQTPGSVLLDFSGDPELAFSQFNHLSIVLMCWWTSEASTWQVTLPSLPVLQTNKPGRQTPLSWGFSCAC